MSQCGSKTWGWTLRRIKHVQSQAVRFNKNIKGRRRVTEGRAQLVLKLLKDRRKSHRLSLLMRILSGDTRHQTLASAYDELVNSRSQTTMITRAADIGEPTSIYESSQTYYNSFLLRSVRDLIWGQITLNNKQLLLPHWKYTDYTLTKEALPVCTIRGFECSIFNEVSYVVSYLRGIISVSVLPPAPGQKTAVFWPGADGKTDIFLIPSSPCLYDPGGNDPI